MFSRAQNDCNRYDKQLPRIRPSVLSRVPGRGPRSPGRSPPSSHSRPLAAPPPPLRCTAPPLRCRWPPLRSWPAGQWTVAFLVKARRRLLLLLRPRPAASCSWGRQHGPPGKDRSKLRRLLGEYSGQVCNRAKLL